MPRVLLGVCGGIAAYKSCDLVRQLRQAQCEVSVVMTQAAQEFVRPLSFEALSGHKVHSAMFGGADQNMAHIELAKQHDVLLVAPATANILAKFAQALADDLLSTLYLAFKGRVILAPAMNTQMWQHPGVVDNLLILKQRGHELVGPIMGELACGDVGWGKMAEPSDIVAHVLGQCEVPGSLQGKKVVVTAGSTREYLDPVRFLSSPSSGKMGAALAEEAQSRGAHVVLIHALVPLPTKPKFTCVEVGTAEELFAQVKKHSDFDVYLSAAAVADYRPKITHSEKIKKSAESLSLELVRNPDILTWVTSQRKAHQVIVGFAAETEQVVAQAQKKLQQKQPDFIIANPVYKEQRGFMRDELEVYIIDHQAVESLGLRSKRQVAQKVLDKVEQVLRGR